MFDVSIILLHYVKKTNYRNVIGQRIKPASYCKVA